MREMVRMAMDELNERQRMAVLLNKFEGMSYADIARSHGYDHASGEIDLVAGTGEAAADVGTVF